MTYELKDIIRFGRYKGWTVWDVLYGWSQPSHNFLIKYFNYCFSEPYQFDNGKGLKDFIVRDFEVLINNKIRVNVMSSIDSESDIRFNLNCMLMAGESYPEKLMFNSVNDLILSKPGKEEDANYTIFADPTYIEWALNKHDSFWLSEGAMEQLASFESNSFYGVDLAVEQPPILSKRNLEAGELIFSYSPRFVLSKLELVNNNGEYRIRKAE